eukprot:scaffold268159_cov32-Tisochrysis_lutea.AAC.1
MDNWIVARIFLPVRKVPLFRFHGDPGLSATRRALLVTLLLRTSYFPIQRQSNDDYATPSRVLVLL